MVFNARYSVDDDIGVDVIAQDPDLSSHFFHVNILDFYTNIVIIFKNAYCRIILANTNK